MIGQACHRAVQYTNTASRFLDGVFASLVQELRNRHHVATPLPLPLPTSSDATTNSEGISLMASIQRAAPASTSTGSTVRRLDPMDMLRALAKVEAPTQSEDIVKLASSLPPVAPCLTGSSSSSTRGAIGQVNVGISAGLMPPTPGRRGMGGLGTGATPSRRAVLGGALTPRKPSGPPI